MAAGSGATMGAKARGSLRAVLAAALALLLAQPGSAIAQANGATIDSDLVRPGAPASPAPPPPAAVSPGTGTGAATGTTYSDPTAAPRYMSAPADPAVANAPMPNGPGCGTRATVDSTYHQDDLISAAENVFGTGAHGLAIMIRDILRKQGEPNGYIVGREAGGAFVVGVRYGSGMLCHKLLGRMPVYWTGPSIGFDVGGSAAKTFVLVYNLNRNEDLFRRFVAGEGQAYLIGGFHVSYLRKGNVVLIPVRMGVGLRLGVNGGYMKITRDLNYMPF